VRRPFSCSSAPWDGVWGHDRISDGVSTFSVLTHGDWSLAAVPNDSGLRGSLQDGCHAPASLRLRERRSRLSERSGASHFGATWFWLFSAPGAAILAKISLILVLARARRPLHPLLRRPRSIRSGAGDRQMWRLLGIQAHLRLLSATARASRGHRTEWSRPIRRLLASRRTTWLRTQRRREAPRRCINIRLRPCRPAHR